MSVFQWLNRLDRRMGRTRSVPVTRSPSRQAQVDAAAGRLVLYECRSCPYCRRVRRAVNRLSLNIAGRDVRRDPVAREELVTGGGKYQVPALRIQGDGGGHRWLYESRDIIKYLQRHFGGD